MLVAIIVLALSGAVCRAFPQDRQVSNLSFVVLQESEKDSLIRISADGKTVTTIAHGAPGLGLSKGRAGNYVVAAESKLFRVSPAGVVTTLVAAPPGAEWVAIVPGPSDDFIVADGQKHLLWRVSHDGKIVEEFARYPGWKPIHAWGLGLTAHESGDYFLLRPDDEMRPAHEHLLHLAPGWRASVRIRR